MKWQSLLPLAILFVFSSQMSAQQTAGVAGLFRSPVMEQATNVHATSELGSCDLRCSAPVLAGVYALTPVR